MILYEMVIGIPPFYAQTPLDTQKKILQWRTYFRIPSQPRVSAECHNIMRSWICAQKDRLSDIVRIKQHPWFAGLDWDNLRNTKAPYKPKLIDDLDTQNFDPVQDDPHKKINQPKGCSQKLSMIKNPKTNPNTFFSDFTFHKCEKVDVDQIREKIYKDKVSRRDSEAMDVDGDRSSMFV